MHVIFEVHWSVASDCTYRADIKPIRKHNSYHTLFKTALEIAKNNQSLVVKSYFCHHNIVRSTEKVSELFAVLDLKYRSKHITHVL